MDDAKGLAGGARGYGEVRGHRSGPGRRHTQVTQELPLIGAHFLNVDSARDGRFDPTRAELLIYAYEDGDWRFYGPSYITSAGRRLRGGGAGGLRRPLRRQCSQRSGFFIERMGHQMHLWVRENPSGMFNQGPSGAAGLRRQKRHIPRLLQVLQLASNIPAVSIALVGAGVFTYRLVTLWLVARPTGRALACGY